MYISLLVVNKRLVYLLALLEFAFPPVFAIIAGLFDIVGRYRSGQTGRTVNPLALPSGVRIPPCPPSNLNVVKVAEHLTSARLSVAKRQHQVPP